MALTTRYPCPQTPCGFISIGKVTLKAELNVFVIRIDSGLFWCGGFSYSFVLYIFIEYCLGCKRGKRVDSSECEIWFFSEINSEYTD